MQSNTTVTWTVRATLICAGLLVGGTAWSGCVEDPVAAETSKQDQLKAVNLTASSDPVSAIHLSVRQYKYLHDARIQAPDGLSNYGQDYQAAYPE